MINWLATLVRSLIAVSLLVLPADAACRQALAIGLDISGSVDQRERRLQLDGLAGALSDATVQDAFLAIPNAPIRFFVYEWSGSGVQHQLVDWRDITSKTELDIIASGLRATSGRPNGVRTALGQAMVFGAAELRGQADCWRWTLDIVGDGKSNQGPRPRRVKEMPQLADITINALVIGSLRAGSSEKRQSEIDKLSAYFRAEVIIGPEAFVETALGFENFQQAMTRKLLKEMQTLAVSSLP